MLKIMFSSLKVAFSPAELKCPDSVCVAWGHWFRKRKLQSPSVPYASGSTKKTMAEPAGKSVVGSEAGLPGSALYSRRIVSPELSTVSSMRGHGMMNASLLTAQFRNPSRSEKGSGMLALVVSHAMYPRLDTKPAPSERNVISTVACVLNAMCVSPCSSATALSLSSMLTPGGSSVSMLSVICDSCAPLYTCVALRKRTFDGTLISTPSMYAAAEPNSQEFSGVNWYSVACSLRRGGARRRLSGDASMSSAACASSARRDASIFQAGERAVGARATRATARRTSNFPSSSTLEGLDLSKRNPKGIVLPSANGVRHMGQRCQPPPAIGELHRGENHHPRRPFEPSPYPGPPTPSSPRPLFIGPLDPLTPRILLTPRTPYPTPFFRDVVAGFTCGRRRPVVRRLHQTARRFEARQRPR